MVPRTHNVQAERLKYLAYNESQRQEFDELNINSSDGENSVLSLEQVNQENFRCSSIGGQICDTLFRCFSILRPIFWIAYYLFCCCLVNNFTAQKNGRERSVIQNFRHTLKTLKKKRFIDSEVFNALVQLYRHN